MHKIPFLMFGGVLCVIAAVLHLAIIIGGENWYRYFGAGERMALMAARGDIYPTIVTIFIACVLFVWSLYAFAGAGLIPKLPFMKFCLCAISAIFFVRGFGAMVAMPLMPQIQTPFMFWSSLLVLFYFIAFAFGTYFNWKSL